MSTERIEYTNASIGVRLLAIIIDIIIAIILAVLCQFGWSLEYDLIWKSLIDLSVSDPFWPVLWFIIMLPLYYWLASSVTDGQTVGKIILGIRVVLDDNSSTKRMWGLHLKRTFFMRGGTKVVQQKDPEVKGL